MGKNIIVSEDTVRDLLEANASLAAWYYELWAALRAVGATSNPPDDASRAAFVERLAADFPEIAAVARSIRSPRVYVPPPITVGARGMDAEEPATLIEPAPARVRESQARMEAVVPEDEKAAGGSVPAPPALVNPTSVKYE